MACPQKASEQIFQSHAGSIEAQLEHNPHPVHPNFNPTLVRLRRDICVCAGDGRCDFNPTLVRLRRRVLERSLIYSLRFQSHAGSIEAGPGQAREDRVIQFQSHAGSIEATIWQIHPTPEMPFQSHAGSIEAVVRATISAPGAVFQSHAGSIEVRYAGTAVPAYRHFNPTLVRLRLGPWPKPAGSIPAFQSHAGSIEANNLPKSGNTSLNFNPTLVRLRECRPPTSLR